MKRIAIVTGASRGIGREIAKMLAKREDIQVIANYNNSEKKAIELQEELKKKILILISLRQIFLKERMQKEISRIYFKKSIKK